MKRLEMAMCRAIEAHLEHAGPPKVPAGGDLLWKWFADLTASRRWTMAGPDPISLQDIEAYRRLTGWPIEERHIRILRSMDEAFRKLCAPSATSRTASSRPMTAGLFDALFG